ncbi:cation diffusion facilitator 1 [Microthyrium microscopicum]|uniref:Cation diffusion facilitator 1 n=1 Tax=Microthyrium microscopicum TaxID=703497 RepID=A0A6A6UPP5_9PEZI|nr:cation diffusion facilitator 1 [Microthyrium microscopicum]
MSSENDIRHAISMRPLPFHSNTEPVRRDSSSTPTYSDFSHHRSHGENVPPPNNTTSESAASNAQGRSTAWEPSTPPADGGKSDPIARHVATSPNAEDDVEGNPPKYTRENDPYELSTKLKSPTEIQEIRANTAKKRNNDTRAVRSPLETGKQAYVAKKLSDFYESQNENIERLLKPVDDHRREARESEDENHLKLKIAITGSFIANVLLAILQVYAAASSGSLSLFTTMADALFDPLSNITLILTHRAVNRVDGRRFPSGKARIETAGNIVFCFLMTAVSLVIIVQSIRDLVEGSSTKLAKFHLPAVIVVGVAFSTKFALFLYCYALRNLYSQIRILWEDHRNDLIINATGLCFSILGSKVFWAIDPAGAIAISCLIICLWLRTAWSEFLLLIGVTADTHMLQHITYISMTHSPDIKAIDTVRSYYSGPRLIVEVDIVMDADDSLRHTHDTAEDLQIKLESLPNVERAYVHVDFETDHSPEHFLRKQL